MLAQIHSLSIDPFLTTNTCQVPIANSPSRTTTSTQSSNHTWDRQMTAAQRRLPVSRHIVDSLICVTVQTLILNINNSVTKYLGNQSVQHLIQIIAHVWITVLIHCQRGRCVLNWNTSQNNKHTYGTGSSFLPWIFGSREPCSRSPLSPDDSPCSLLSTTH